MAHIKRSIGFVIHRYLTSHMPGTRFFIRLLQCSVLCFCTGLLGGILSQAIYDTVLNHDYYALTTLRMLGGRVKPEMGNTDELRHTFLKLIANNKPFTADRFLEAGMDPDLMYAHETTRTLLAEAVFAGRSAIVESLLKHGADPNPTGSDPPLLLAVQSENRQIVQLLLQHGAKVSLTRESALWLHRKYSRFSAIREPVSRL